MKDFFCVNALSGETSFLREFTIEELVEELIVSMPYRAKHHFYNSLRSSKERYFIIVSMPYRAKHHFYNPRATQRHTHVLMCQCPIGRNIISTMKKKARKFWFLSVSMPYRAKHHFYLDAVINPSKYN